LKEPLLEREIRENPESTTDDMTVMPVIFLLYKLLPVLLNALLGRELHEDQGGESRKNKRKIFDGVLCTP
jgi:hypothetical protein